jgi:hypothetical protein
MRQVVGEGHKGSSGRGILRNNETYRRYHPRADAYSPHLFTKSDTAGEVAASDAAALSAIRRAHGVRRVFTRAVSRSHAPRRSPFSPTAVRRWPRGPRARPMERVRRRRVLRVPREIVPATPARRAYSAGNAAVASRCRAAWRAWYGGGGRRVRVRRGERFFERRPWAPWAPRRHALLEDCTLMTACPRFSPAGVQRRRVVPAGQRAWCRSPSL